MFEEGQKNYNRKKSASKLTLRKQTPNDFESDLIHALFLKQSYPISSTPAPPTAASLSSSESTSIVKGSQPTTLKMKDTILHNVQIMQPQYRNRHNFMIFGGFLLKSTFELAFTCASAISHSRPTFIALDPSTFENPVPVGSVLYLSATVAYSDSPLLDDEQFRDRKVSPQGKSRIQIRVDSKVRDIAHGSVKPTGVFNYTFEVEGNIKVIPETYGQFMMFLDARRRCLASSEEKGKEGA
jgi:acyl-coenzyme A thioesterase 9